MRKMRIFSALLVLSMLLSAIPAMSKTTAKFCWKDSYGRGVGKPLTKCPRGLVKSGLICYRKCRSGYKGVGPVCWQYCPRGFRDDGAFCAKPKPYGRGAGYAIWDKNKCNRRHKQGCQKHLAMWYPKCRKGFHPVGCCICSPNCQKGQKDIGVSCAKKSYGRGVGKPMVCARGREQNGLLCYKRCKRGFKGVGPVCWDKPPRGWVNCGMGAAKNSRICAQTVIGQVSSVAEVAAFVASLGSSSAATTGAKAAGKGAKHLNKLRKQFKRLQKVYKSKKGQIQKFMKKYPKAVKRIKRGKKWGMRGKKAGSTAYSAAFLGLNANKMSAEDIVRTSAEIASMVDPTGVSSVVSAYTYPKCHKVTNP